MKIRYNPSIDLFTAIMLYTRWDEINDLSPESGGLSASLSRWYEEAEKELPGPLKNELDYFVKDFIGLTFLPVMFALEGGLREVKECFERLHRVSPDRLPEKLYASYEPPDSWEEVEGDEGKIRRALEKAGGTTRPGEADRFIEFCRHPGEFWHKYLNAAEEFYNRVLEPREKKTTELMEARIREDQRLLDTDAAGFFGECLRMAPPDRKSSPEIYICFYDEIDIIQIDAPECLIYGWRRSVLKTEDTFPLEEAYRILADDKRRTILQLLCRRPWYIRELADRLNITSATVSYHVSRLGTLDLVRYERGEKNRVYYQADRERVDVMLEGVRSSILGKSSLKES